MLAQLSIRDLAVVEHVDIPLGTGLSVLTGETGAGKSVLVGALSLVLGGRAQSESVRTGADQAVVEALFEVEPGSDFSRRLERADVRCPDGELLVRRVVPRSGRSRVYLNGQLATLGMLTEVMRGAVDLTSQHEHVSLLDPDRHLDTLDAFGGLLPLRAEVEEAHTEVQGYQSALDALDLDEAERARREDYLKFALDEIAEVAPTVGELDELERQRKRMRGSVELIEGVQAAEATLYSGDGAAVELVGKVHRSMERLATIDPELASLAGGLEDMLAGLEDVARDLGGYASRLSVDPGQLEEVEDRMEALKKLARKHGGSLDAVLQAQKSFETELDELVNDEARRADLGALLEAAHARRAAAAQKLTSGRKKAKRALEKAAEQQLAGLAMRGTKFTVTLKTLASPNARGAESAEFLLAANVGEPARPLRKTASGGELSRVLLALKNVLADRAPASTFVFDEVDTGIGGAVADVLGAQLAEVATRGQVIVVTHLPQVAAHAQHHFRVLKEEAKGRTLTRVELLQAKARTEEIARMLGGVRITKKTRALAVELLERGVGGALDTE